MVNVKTIDEFFDVTRECGKTTVTTRGDDVFYLCGPEGVYDHQETTRFVSTSMGLNSVYGSPITVVPGTFRDSASPTDFEYHTTKYEGTVDDVGKVEATLTYQVCVLSEGEHLMGGHVNAYRNITITLSSEDPIVADKLMGALRTFYGSRDQPEYARSGHVDLERISPTC
jgi:hypothetical protein